MKILTIITFTLCISFVSLYANNPQRQTPYPQQENIIYLNPAPLFGKPQLLAAESLKSLRRGGDIRRSSFIFSM